MMFSRLLRSLRYGIMAHKTPKDPLIVILGATGTGKSQLAIDLAIRFNGEVINGDAMQMYEGLPIVTNKITVEEQKGVPHHLLGFLGLQEESWRVGLFKQKACQILKEIRSRGRLPILVGGTHYYTQSLLFEDELVEEDCTRNTEPGLSNQEISDKYPVLDGPTESMLEWLKLFDPVMAEQWHPKDRRKIRRSLEIFLTTGKRASDIYSKQREAKAMKMKTGDDAGEDAACPESQLESVLLFWVHSDPQLLKQRLDARVDKMVQAGLLEEVKAMKTIYTNTVNNGGIIDRGRGIWVSIGWKEFEQYLNVLDGSPGDLHRTLESCIEQVKAATRQYANRQTRWIRHKLVAALADEDALHRLFLLDGTDIDTWQDSVSTPAINIADSFLAGKPLPLPTELSEAARMLLSPQKSSESGERLQRICEICSMTTYTGGEWHAHLKSRRHRARVRKNEQPIDERDPRWRSSTGASSTPLDLGVLDGS